MNVVDTGLPRSPEAVRAARQLVRRHAMALEPQQRNDAALMVSELVTNALLHGTGTIWLRVDVEPHASFCVAVSDAGDVAVAPSPTLGAHGGWGLRIVDQLADDWGIREGSTQVWFRIGRP